jgi:hypothetical protein
LAGRTSNRPIRLLESASEVLFSLNLAWVFVWIERAVDRRFGRYSVHFNGFSRFIDHLFRRVSIAPSLTILDQIAWSFLLAVILFLFVRLVSRFSSTPIYIGVLTAIVAISASPIASLLLPRVYSIPSEVLVGQYYQWLYRAELYRGWLFLELIVAVICTVLYCLRRMFVDPSMAILFLLLHFGLWSWITGMNLTRSVLVGNFLSLSFWLEEFFFWGGTVLGFLAALSSWLYVIMSTGTGVEASTQAKA